jgi:hypothetical protein
VGPPSKPTEARNNFIAVRHRCEGWLPVDIGEDLAPLLVDPEETRCPVETNLLVPPEKRLHSWRLRRTPHCFADTHNGVDVTAFKRDLFGHDRQNVSPRDLGLS